MTKRSFTLLLCFAMIVLSALPALAQAPAISITSPANNAVISSVDTPLSVTVAFSALPPDASLLLRAWDDAETNLFAQDQTIPGGSPWVGSLDFQGRVTPGTHGHITASIIDGGGVSIATSTIQVTYGSAPPPTTPPTNTPAPTDTPVPTNTPPGGASITVISPVNGSTFDINATIPVSGATTNLPAGATVMVRLRNAGGSTLGQQSIVPNADGTWALTVSKTAGDVDLTATGSIIAFIIDSGSTVATSNVVSLNFTGVTPTPAVAITSPTSGTTIPLNPSFVASGTSSSLPSGATIRVFAYRSGSATPIAQQVVTPASNGSWNATLAFTQSISPGTPGYIIAYGQVGDTVVATSPQVNLTWGYVSSQPVVRITSPTSGSVVGVGNIVRVQGTASNVFENNVVVRALNTFGDTLAQQATTADASGFWSVDLVVNAPGGTPGAIFAFATSPMNGSIVASSRVEVFFNGQCFIRTDWHPYIVRAGDTLLRIAQRTGSTVTALAYANCLTNANLVYTGQRLYVPNPPTTPQPTNATLRIITPTNGEELDTDQRITVTGAGRNLAGNDIVVRALDANGHLLAQQTTRAGAAGSGGESQWQVSLSIRIQDATRGTIYAVVQSPTTGTVLADALVNVTYGSALIITVPPQSQSDVLFITQPALGDPVTPQGQLQVSGRIVGPFDGNVFVRILDNRGDVIDEVQADLSRVNDRGDFNWQALLELDAEPGTWGTVYAYVPSPFTDESVIAAAVNITFGQLGSGPYVTIDNPLPYSILDTDQPITVGGMGGRLFEGNVVVRAVDNEGHVLAEVPTIINSPDAGTGGEGDWQLELDINVTAGTRGWLNAFSTSPQDGSIVAFFAVPVTFGDPTTTANFVQITAPLPGTIADPGQTLMIAGTADRSGGNTVRVQIVDEAGNILVDEPRNLNPSVDGDYGIWQMLIELRGIPEGTRLNIVALTASRFDGTTLASDSVEIVVGAAAN